MLDNGKAVRTDKLSIIADAVKEVNKLRAESHQLRQLNKFLEARCRKEAVSFHLCRLKKLHEKKSTSCVASRTSCASSTTSWRCGAAVDVCSSRNAFKRESTSVAPSRASRGQLNKFLEVWPGCHRLQVVPGLSEWLSCVPRWRP